MSQIASCQRESDPVRAERCTPYAAGRAWRHHQYFLRDGASWHAPAGRLCGQQAWSHRPHEGTRLGMGPRRILVLSVDPGYVETDVVAGLKELSKIDEQAIVHRTPLRRMASSRRDRRCGRLRGRRWCILHQWKQYTGRWRLDRLRRLVKPVGADATPA